MLLTFAIGCRGATTGADGTKYRAKQQRDQLMAKLKKGRQGEGDEI